MNCPVCQVDFTEKPSFYGGLIPYHTIPSQGLKAPGADDVPGDERSTCPGIYTGVKSNSEMIRFNEWRWGLNDRNEYVYWLDSPSGKSVMVFREPGGGYTSVKYSPSVTTGGKHGGIESIRGDIVATRLYIMSERVRYVNELRDSKGYELALTCNTLVGIVCALCGVDYPDCEHHD